MLDADRHPYRINVGDPQVDDFVETQTCRIGGEKHRPMFRIRRLRDHALDLFVAQNGGQRLVLTRRRDSERRPVALQRRVKEETQAVRRHVARTP